MRTSRTVFKIDQIKRYSIAFQINENPEIMRRTRSNSNVETIVSHTGAVKRSLRSTNNEEFHEIPNTFRIRPTRSSGQPASSEKVEKLTPTRRSSRLSSTIDEIENLFQKYDSLPNKTRKRRFQSLPSDGSPVCASRRTRASSIKESAFENGVKPAKVLHIDEETTSNGSDSDMSPGDKANRICSRTRQKLIENGEISPKNAEECDSNDTNDVCDANAATATPNGLPSSVANSHPRPRKLSETATKCNGQAASDSQNICDMSDIVAEKLANCVCKSGRKCVENEACDLCGVDHSPSKEVNGNTLDSKNSETVGVATPTHNLRSNGSILYSPVAGNSSPLVAEEATKSCKKASSEDFQCRRRSRRISEKSDLPASVSSDTESSSHPRDVLKVDSPIEASTQLEQDECTQKHISDIETKPCSSGRPDDDNAKRGDDKTDEDGDVPTVDCKENGFPENEVQEHGPDHQHEISSEFYFSQISDSGSDEKETMFNKRKRKMNLRSSGVRCDPDFYTLSLDLMIKRSQRRNALTSDFKGLREQENELESDPGQVQDADTDTQMPQAENAVVEAKCDAVNLEGGNEPSSPAPGSSDVTESSSTSPTLDRTSLPPQNINSPYSSSTPNRTYLRNQNKLTPHNKSRGAKGLCSKPDKSPAPGFRIVVPDPREPPPLFVEEPPSGSDVYFFESDHVALKHNQDYHNLLHTVSLLESQRHKCLQDIEVLESRKTSALSEPITFVAKLQTQTNQDLPLVQKVPALPEIDWSRYTSVYGTFDHVFSEDFKLAPPKPVTRKKKINFETGPPRQKSKGESSRSQTFKLAWTVEEQRKLEELLMKYPSEEIEFTRYRKIASAMGNRTPMQVQSRVQKYFLKLAKAGLPIPGRMPKLAYCARKKAKSHPHQSLTRMSTFFPSFHVPVRMTDDRTSDSHPGNDNDDEGGGWTINQDQVSDEEDIPQEMRYSDEYIEILRLKRQRRERLKVLDQDGHQALAQHVGYECDMCSCDPILGVRYHCIDCPAGDGVDLCQSCIRWQGKFVTDLHKTTHRMEPVYKAENFTDSDYVKFVSCSGEYNYLDPNFFPPCT